MNPSTYRKDAGIALAVAAGVLCIGAGWGSGWRDIRAAMSSLTSVRADFVQTRTLEILDGPLESTGRFFYRYPGDLRWEYFTPVRQVLIMHDGDVKRYIRREGRFKEAPGAGLEGARVVMTRIASWLRGSFEDNSVFKARLTGNNPPSIDLVPVDDNLKKRVKLITIHLGDRPGVISGIVMAGRDLSTTSWRFASIRTNQPISDRVFMDPNMEQARP